MFPDVRLYLGIACVGAAIVGVASFVVHERQVGARKALDKVERMDRSNVKRASEAARRSADPNARGLRDPYQRTDD